MRSRPLERRLQAGFAVIVLIVGLAVGTAWRNSQRVQQANSWVVHTLTAQRELDEVLFLVTERGRGLRGFLITGRESNLASHGVARGRIGESLRRLRTLTADNPGQQRRWRELEGLITAQLDVQDRLLGVAKEQGLEPGRQLFATAITERALEATRETVRAMQAEEDRLLRERQQALASSDWRERAALAALTAIVLGILLAGYLVVRHHVAEQIRAEEGLRELNAHLEERVRERTADLEAANRELERDIVERERLAATLRDSELRLRATLDSMLEGCQIVGFDWRYLYVNDAAAEQGRQPKQALLGRTMMEAYPGIENSEMFATLRRCMEQRVPQRMENEFAFPDGTRGWFQLSVEPAPEGVFILSMDITERKRAEAAQRQINADWERRVQERTRALEEANHELEAFSYSVSHDLRQPLRAIDGFSQVLLEDHRDHLDAKGHPHLERIRAAAQRMGLLIDDMLNLSRITRAEIKREPVDLSALARTAWAAARERDPARSVAVEVQDGLTTEADPRLLGVALGNLIGNAWKFTRDKPQARIAVGALPGGPEPVYFVRDNGAGFDMAYADKLFAPFQRLHSPREFEGTGIGLAIVARVVQRHGGRVWAEGAVGQGATVYFTLPGEGV
jgi:PAS domain S-box-containing protein